MTPEEDHRLRCRGQRLWFEAFAICLIFAAGVIIGLRALAEILQ